MNHVDRGVSSSPSFVAPAAEDTAAVGDLAYAPSTLRASLAALRRRRWALATWMAVCLGGAGLYLALTPPDYSASAQVLLEPHRPLPTGTENGVAAAASALDSAQAESQIHVVQSERVLKYVFDTLDLGNSPDYAQAATGVRGRIMGALRALLPGAKGDQALDTVLRPAAARARAFAAFVDRVGVRRIGQSYVLEIAFHAPRPEEAARIANAVASAYLRDQVETRAADAQRGIEYLQGRIALLKAERDAADAAIRGGTIPDIAFPDSDARVISAALTPLGPSSPQAGLLLVLAGAFGLLSGLGAIVTLHNLDRTIRSDDQIWGDLHVDCLGVVPRLQSHARRGHDVTAALDLVLADPASDFADSLRSVRAALLSRGAAPSSIGLFACAEGAGSSTIAGNLAHLLAASGEAVALIDADRRRPTLSSRLAPGATTGLSELVAAGEVGGRLPLVQTMPGLELLPAIAEGAESPPNLFVGSAVVRETIARLRETRIVIVDCPALARGSDGLALGALLDGIVIVAEAGRTTLDEVNAAIRMIRSAGAPLLGVVLNKAEADHR